MSIYTMKTYTEAKNVEIHKYNPQKMNGCEELRTTALGWISLHAG